MTCFALGTSESSLMLLFAVVDVFLMLFELGH